MSTKGSTYYIAGPMTGIPFANIPAFDAAAKDLRDRGYSVVSPAELDDEKIRNESAADPTGNLHSGSWGEFLARDVKLISDEVGAVVCLPGWGNSRGANLEVYVAMTCGYPLFTYAPETAAGFKSMDYAEAFQTILTRHKIVPMIFLAVGK